MEYLTLAEQIAKSNAPQYFKQLRRKTFVIGISNEFWLNHATGLSLAERCVLITLKFYDNKFGECRPGVRRLTKDLQISQNTVLRAIRGLESKKFITTKVRGRRTNLYSLGTLK